MIKFCFLSSLFYNVTNSLAYKISLPAYKDCWYWTVYHGHEMMDVKYYDVISIRQIKTQNMVMTWWTKNSWIGKGTGFAKILWTHLFLARYIPRPPHPPPPPGHLSGTFSLLLPHGGEFAKEGQPWSGALSKQLCLSDFKSSIWFLFNMCK